MWGELRKMGTGRQAITHALDQRPFVACKLVRSKSGHRNWNVVLCLNNAEI
ncbi:hypothetical protein BDA96_04G263000 [Sorghum bicolor]|uniref:Uncharacterized protein n=2 Tax=Sorghum bicolor TaxID=4558 RepID=A0A1Z5RPD1_SORBI|nr:hypothetical protein BDA96_04G263000 [Sorghum bicolor]OQU85451.1 hypothetical protein SORBI_3004G246950 [Sorghum bicolor]